MRSARRFEEAMAREFCRWDSRLKLIALRFSNVMEPADYAAFPSYDADARLRKWNLWAYVDARDAAQAVRRALDHPGTGFEAFIIANEDTVMQRPSGDLLAEVFPDVEIRGSLGVHETLLSIDKARLILGYQPVHPWRGEIDPGT